MDAIDMNSGSDTARSSEVDGREGPSESPFIDSGPGYWAGRWTEFKRLMGISWHESWGKEIIFLCTVASVVLIVGHFLFGWR
mgnify:CR=1 FL=1